MKSIDQLNAEHAAAVAKLEAEHALAAALPVAPDSVMLTQSLKGTPWITFKRPLWAALDLIAEFQVIPFHRYKGTFTELAPEGCAKEGSEAVEGPFAFGLEVHSGEGFGPTAKLFFFSPVGDKIAKIRVELEGPGYIGAFDAFRGSRQPVAWGRRGEVTQWRIGPNAALNGYADSYIQWATGDTKTGQHTYMFCADYDETLPAVEMTHAMGQLANMRDEFHPAPELVETTERAAYWKLAGGTYQATAPGAPPPMGQGSYYNLESLKQLKGDAA